ncbi:MAG TPA: EamA family transporter [Syntrophales bacterium]|nr:EamA family transporter [Syntrophales bacterium]
MAEIFGNWRLLIFLYLVVSAVWAMLAKITTNYMNAFTASLSVLTCAWLTVLLFSMPRVSFAWNRGLLFAAACGIMGGTSSLFFYGALRHAPVNLIVPISSLYIVFTIILSSVFLGETLTLKQLAGIVLGITAIWLLTS